MMDTGSFLRRDFSNFGVWELIQEKSLRMFGAVFCSIYSWRI